MSKRVTTPVFALRRSGYWSDETDEGALYLCSSSFKKFALPNWTGPLPRRVRFHLSESKRGRWKWDIERTFAELRPPSGPGLTTDTSVDDWFDGTFNKGRFRFNVTMEIVEP